MTRPDDPGYVDTDYLKQVGELLAAYKRHDQTLMHMAAGQHVLDVGCGPATDTISLAQHVGPTGRVVGVDHDPEMVATAQQKAEEAGVAAYVEHRQADALNLPFEDNTFHACHSERLFQHLAQPERALQEMVRVTRPGGYVVVRDADWYTKSVDTPHIETEQKLMAAFISYNAPSNPLVGRQLYRMMQQAGLTHVTAEPSIMGITDYATWNMMTLAERLRDYAIEEDLITQAAWEAFDAQLRDYDAQGLFFAQIGGIVAAGQKPA